MKSIKVAFYREGNQWVAQALNVEVSTFGSTLDEAKVAVREALELFFEDEDRDVADIDAVTIEAVDVQVA